MAKALFHSFSKKATKAEIIRQFRLLEIENAKLRTENEDRRKTQSEQADMLFKQGKDIEILKGDYKELQTQEHAIRQERNILKQRLAVIFTEKAEVNEAKSCYKQALVQFIRGM